MKIENISVDKIIPYKNNPRINDDAVAGVVESIKQCGELDPIEVDENNIILSGHTRLKAYNQLGYDSISVLRITGLTEPQKRKYRLLTNKTGEKAEWDFDKNVNIDPEQLRPSSGYRVWWRCASGHSWRTSVQMRVRGQGCPYCLGQTPTRGRII